MPAGFLFIVLFSFSMQAYIVAVGTLTLKDTHSGIRQSRSSCGSAETQTGACAHTHTHIGAHSRGGTMQWRSHASVASVSVGQGAVVSDHLFSFPPCLFSEDSVINSLTRD